MSSREEPEDLVGQLDVAMITEALTEPHYISELARKMQEMNLPLGYDMGDLEDVETIQNTWGDINENTALTRVMLSLTVLTNQDAQSLEVVEPVYDSVDNSSEGESQKIGSTHISRGEDGIYPTDEWKTYTIVKNVGIDPARVGQALTNEGYSELGSRMEEYIDPTTTIEEKVNIVDELSSSGNDISRWAEEIMQDVMERQFREYEVTEVEDYNDPGVDFMVVDDGRRKYGLVIEVSTRWVNPIGDEYISNKLMSAMELEEEHSYDSAWDVLILAPNFTNKALENYEDYNDSSWHNNPEKGMVHLHRVPQNTPSMYRPFTKKPQEVNGKSGGRTGNPIIVPDSSRIRDLAMDTGHVGDGYPVVDDENSQLIEYLGDVYRDFVVITESRYRNMLRESLEPLLWGFMRPYKIEQFLIDTYWDKGLTQSGVGKLVDRSGSTIGRWMREWGIMRRGTGAPELSDDVIEIWQRMYRGEEPFPQQFSGYRIQAEYNRHPLWSLQDWREWYETTTEDERKQNMALQESFRNELDYTIMVGASDRLLPSYSFILQTLRDNGVEIRQPDEAPRVPYSAYPSKGALEYMLNKDENTIVDVSEE